MSLITPRTLKGFRDVLPVRALHQQRMIRTLQDVFRAHGYGPIETPALEYAEILKGKGGEDSDKELFEFTDKGGRPVALRFDLTVPLARFVAEHQNDLVFPFRRSHIGSCWRGERPQRGRAREFLQCDADLIGPVSVAADAEILVLMCAAYEALDVGPVTLRINDRRVLGGIVGHLAPGVPVVAALRALDKREKLGETTVRDELVAAGATAEGAAALIDVTTPRGDASEVFACLDASLAADDSAGRAGLEGLRRVLELAAAAGVREGALRVDPSVARGLDYYTGIVLEAQLDALPDIGSVGSGGRYDDLASLYTKSRLPGVGCSIGVTRLLDAMEALGRASDKEAPADVLVVHPGEEDLPRAFAIAAALRRAGIGAEVFPEDKKHGQQMRYADKAGIPLVVTVEADGGWHAKRLADGAFASFADEASLVAWLRAPNA
ncbi:MAG: histidine--tRNA ligase [Planctomycetota bacterium]